MKEANEYHWVVSISGEGGKPEDDKITLIHHDSPKIHVEIAAPGLRSAGDKQRNQGRKAIQDMLHALQKALDSPTALAGFPPNQ